MKLVILFFVLSVLAVGQDKPSMDDVKKFMDYYSGGKAAVAYDLKLTSKIEEMNPTDEITELKAGNVLYVWAKFFVPAKTEDNNYKVIIKFGNTVLKEKSFELSTGDFASMGYRSFTAKGLHNKGTHKVELWYGDKLEKEMEINVVE